MKHLLPVLLLWSILVNVLLYNKIPKETAVPPTHPLLKEFHFTEWQKCLKKNVELETQLQRIELRASK